MRWQGSELGKRRARLLFLLPSPCLARAAGDAARRAWAGGSAGAPACPAPSPAPRRSPILLKITLSPKLPVSIRPHRENQLSTAAWQRARERGLLFLAVQRERGQVGREVALLLIVVI